MDTSPLYSIVIPTKDDPDFTVALRHKIQTITPILPQSEIIVVNDGSTPPRIPTEILNKLKNAKARLTLINLPTSMGKGEALRRGAAKSTGKYLIFIDGDNDIDPKVVLDIAHKLQQGYMFVYSNKFMPESKVTYSSMRLLGSKCIRLVIKTLFPSIKIKDTQTGAKGYTREVWNTLQSNLITGIKGFAFEVEYAVILSKLNIRITDVPVRILPQHTPSFPRQLRRASRLIYDLIVLRLLSLKRTTILSKTG